MRKGKYVMIDLFSGLGGASQAMIDRGWQVWRVDIDSGFEPDICCDVRDFLELNEDIYRIYEPDLIWASPPCDEFSKSHKPWYGFPVPSEESIELIYAVLRIVRKLRPKLWILENVVGAQRWLGKAPYHCGAFYLWGWFPFEKLRLPHSIGHGKARLFPSEKRKVLRAKIPYELSKAVALVAEETLSRKREALHEKQSSQAVLRLD